MQQHVDDLAEVIRRLKASLAHLVGNSWGGFICVLAALQHPELVATLTVEEPPLIPLLIGTQPGPAKLIRLLLTHPRDGLALIKHFRTALGPAFGSFKSGDRDNGVEILPVALSGPKRTRHCPLTSKKRRSPTGRRSAHSCWEPVSPRSLRPCPGRQGPHSAGDWRQEPKLLRRLVDRLGELIPDAKRADIVGASHLMHYEQPAAVNRAVREFIARR